MVSAVVDRGNGGPEPPPVIAVKLQGESVNSFKENRKL